MDRNRSSKKRIAWLVNHKTLMKFEVPLLTSFGFEVFCSKKLPKDLTHRKSCLVDFSYDNDVTLPMSELTRLNEFNFYEDALSEEIIALLNDNFNIIITAMYEKPIVNLIKHFKHNIIVRVFGRESPQNYSQYFEHIFGPAAWDTLKAIQNRFWLASAYETIPLIENDFLKERSIILPVGIPSDLLSDRNTWQGGIKQIMFVCPRILDSPYYNAIYRTFKKEFGQLPHLIFGDQLTPLDDTCVKGWIGDGEFREFLQRMQVMFYHSQEPRHLHYHPLEAMVYGMPVIFMNKGLLEYFGGSSQPGLCKSFEEAKHKIQMILQGNLPFIEEIQVSQSKILEFFSMEYCKQQWENNFLNIFS
jgi:hypothetical protein